MHIAFTSVHSHVPLSHQTSLTKCKFKDKIFKIVTAKYYTKHKAVLSKPDLPIRCFVKTLMNKCMINLTKKEVQINIIMRFFNLSSYQIHFSIIMPVGVKVQCSGSYQTTQMDCFYISAVNILSRVHILSYSNSTDGNLIQGRKYFKVANRSIFNHAHHSIFFQEERIRNNLNV